MFACIYRRSVSKASSISGYPADLIDLAFTFSPLIELTTADTVVLDVSGQSLLFGSGDSNVAINSARNLANEIARRSQTLNLKVNVAIGANPDIAIHTARAFKGVTIIDSGEELLKLGKLSLKSLDCSLVAIDATRMEEIHETFALWGVRTFADLARLPLSGVSERLGQEGVRLQKLAQGKTDRKLNLLRPPIGFEQSLELEHPVSELEPLSFILSRLLNQLCANLHEYALATNELRLRLVTEPARGFTNEDTTCDSETNIYERTISLPVPMRNPKTLLRLLLFDIETQPPSAPIVAVTLSAQPVKPRESQAGLFVPLAPEPEKLEITLARLAKLVGASNVGSPEALDTHRPDAFRMKRFNIGNAKKRKVSKPPADSHKSPVMGFRIFRPPWRADVTIRQGQPVHIRAHSFGTVRGKIVCASGPWRASGDWWRSDVWARDEWDVAVIDPRNEQSEVICRIYRDLTNEEWFVAGIYD
jgi:protein ImuB